MYCYLVWMTGWISIGSMSECMVLEMYYLVLDINRFQEYVIRSTGLLNFYSILHYLVRAFTVVFYYC